MATSQRDYCTAPSLRAPRAVTSWSPAAPQDLFVPDDPLQGTCVRVEFGSSASRSKTFTLPGSPEADSRLRCPNVETDVAIDGFTLGTFSFTHLADGTTIEVCACPPT